MAGRSKGAKEGTTREPLVQGATLEPIRTVTRELERPDGTKLVVEVPVYPPFRLEDRSAPETPARARSKAGRKRSSDAA